MEEADFLLAHGTEVLGMGDGKPPIKVALEEIKAILQKAAGRGLPLIVANPDVVTVSGNSLVPMPGTFARWHKEFGGQVRHNESPCKTTLQAALDCSVLVLHTLGIFSLVSDWE